MCFWQASASPVLLLAAAVCCGLRLWLNMLDGMVALASGKASRLGEIANELPDRFSDVIVFVGIAHSGLCHPLVGYWASIMALLTAYVGTLGQAVGVHREFAGVMSKPWRMAVVIAAAFVVAGLQWRGIPDFSERGLSVFDVACAIVIAGCVQTIVLRIVRILAQLRDLDEVTESGPPKNS
ncbi:MAG: CDP-alcohol phosphatidyltransferase family protein [Pirellulales bacterium]